MGSCTGLVIQQILISSNILWGAVASAALEIVVEFPDTQYRGLLYVFFLLCLYSRSPPPSPINLSSLMSSSKPTTN